jgi:aconitate decarboxylase
MEDRTANLATFLSELKYEDLPADVVLAAKKSILNALGCGLGYAHHAPAEKVFQYVRNTQTASDTATILGRSIRTSAENAALINGIAITTADFDDTHLKTVNHPSGTALAALLALAEQRPMSGKDFLLAFVVGVEAQIAVGIAVSPGHYKSGWHITGTTGTFGATAAIAKGMKLDSKHFAAALGHASSMAAGTRAMFGTDTKTLHMGRGAQNGLMAAGLASHVFESCKGSVEAWARLVSDTVKVEEIDALASSRMKDWQILQNTFKPYPCGIVVHPLIDAGIQAKAWLSDGNATAESVEKIEATVSPQCTRLCNVRHPRTGLETIFSLYHGIASGMLYGEAGPKQFSDDGCKDDAARIVREKVSVLTDEGTADDAAVLRVTLAGGREEVFRIAHATGSLARPMTEQQIEAKFRSLASTVLDEENIQKTVMACWQMEVLEDMAAFVRGLGR